MKVLFLTNIPSPYRVDFFNELGKHCDLTVLYELQRASDRDKKWKADKAYHYDEVFLNGKKFGADSALCFSVIKYLADNSYDIIVIGGYSTPTGMLAIEYLNLKKKPFILNFDGGIIKDNGGFKERIKKHFIGSAKAWLSTGINTNNYAINYGAKYENIFIYPFTSVKDEKILKKLINSKSKDELKRSLGMMEKKIIITVGQFIHRKGIDILLEASNLLPKEYGVYIIGGNPTEEYIKLKEKYNLTNVHFVGFKAKDELEKYYKAADLFILPTREDIWGLVINEAMAYGLPIITTNKCVAGVEIIEDGVNGYVVPVESKGDIARRTIEILQCEEKAHYISANNIEKIRLYTIEKMAERHIEIFKEVLNKKYE